MKEKNVQIPESLFYDLVKLTFMEQPPTEIRQACIAGMEAKVTKMAENELFHQSKVAHTRAEREAALNKWFDSKGIPEKYRVTEKRGI